MKIKNLLTQFLFLSIFTLILILSVYNITFGDTQIVTSVGPMQISKIESGLTVYQGYRGKYYTISPFNDFYIDASGVRSTFITKDEVENKSYITKESVYKTQKIADTLTSYFGVKTPSTKIEGKLGGATYTSFTQDNTAVISYNFTPKKSINPKRMGITLSYNADDIVFDSSQNLYNAFSSTDIENFEKIYGLSFTPKKGELHLNIPGGRMYIANPKGAYLLIVEADAHQQISLNKNSRLIEITQDAEKIDDSYKASLTLKVEHTLRKEDLAWK